MQESQQVLTPLAVLENIVPNLHEAADKQGHTVPGMSPVEQAALLAGLNNAMGALRDAAKDGVLYSPQNQIGSLLQSMVAENPTSVVPLASGQGLEAKFDTHDWLGWLTTFWQILKHSKKFDWTAPVATPETVPQFKNNARIAVFADWGTGMYGAPLIKSSIENDVEAVDMIWHLGDTYYSGTDKEIASRFVGMWPNRPGALNRALNGNHEMYSGGSPYKNALKLAPFNQASSCVAYQNDHWIIVGLDTAYDDYDLANNQAAWLGNIVSKAQGRKVVLFSHHQPFSLLNTQGPKIVIKLLNLLDAGDIFAWYWGHEHECVLYDKHPRWKLHGRCIGHAGMPEFRPEELGPPVATRQFRRFLGGKISPPQGVPGDWVVPDSWILDGPNPYIKGEETKFSPHGYVMLEFDGDHLIETVRDADGTEIRTAELT